MVLHAIALAPFIDDMLPDDLFDLPRPTVVVAPIEFELVSPPERPTPSNNVSRYLSTVSSQASDQDPAVDQSALPRSDGRVPIPDTPSRTQGVEGGGERELPPVPEVESDLAEAFERSKFTTQSSPSRDLSLPDETEPFRSQQSARASVGGITINTTAWDFAPYLLELKQRVKQHWIPPLAFTALGAIHGYTKVNFRIYPDGSMQALSITDSEGHESLHRASENAIKGAAPFRPLPEDFPEDYLDITFGFYYLLPGDEERYFPERK